MRQRGCVTVHPPSEREKLEWFQRCNIRRPISGIQAWSRVLGVALRPRSSGSQVRRHTCAHLAPVVPCGAICMGTDQRFAHLDQFATSPGSVVSLPGSCEASVAGLQGPPRHAAVQVDEALAQGEASVALSYYSCTAHAIICRVCDIKTILHRGWCYL